MTDGTQRLPGGEPGSLTAAQYADCVPINPFGPTAVTRTAFNYFAETTTFRQSNILDNLGGSISGTVSDDWAGPIKAALSAEARLGSSTATRWNGECAW